MVADDDNVAHFQPRIQTARSVAENHLADAKTSHQVNREGRLMMGDAFVAMKATCHGNDWNRLQVTKNKLPSMTRRGRCGQMRDIAKGNCLKSVDLIGDLPEAASQDDCSVRSKWRLPQTFLNDRQGILELRMEIDRGRGIVHSGCSLQKKSET